LLQEWPVDGPPLRWRTDGIGQGIASVAVSGGSVYTLGTTGEHEHVISLNEATGELRWRAAIARRSTTPLSCAGSASARQPLNAERLYASTAQGDLVCLQTADGKELWRKNYPKDFGALRRS
jgi:outer membrane protein assembly factor BamB